MVFYRKYRPQRLEDLDSTLVREKLFNVLKNPDKSPHAFLFTGPKGLGKTSTARIIAKVVNCLGDSKKRGKSGIDPCNSCEQCVSITNGNNLDVLEIDAASNRGIDEIRELKETIKLSPLTAKKKVYIIDEVHMLTTEAFNALLKTLEEPPEHAMFMLCTTEPQKVPPTILSRTFHLHFQKATYDELVRSFLRIKEAEKLTIDEDALYEIARFSDGGFRDGTKLLEEIVSQAGNMKITRQFIEETLNIAGSDTRIHELISALEMRNTKAALSEIEAIVSDGSDISYYLEQVIHHLHQSMLKQAGVLGDEGEQFSLSLQDTKTLLSLLHTALFDMRTAVMKQLPFELAVMEWGIKPETKTTSSDVHHVELTAQINTGVSVSSLKKQIGNMQKTTALYGEEKEAVKKRDTNPPANVSVLHFSADGDITPEWLANFWACIIHDVKEHNHTLAGVLRGCMIKSFDRKQLTIETAYAFHRDKLDNAKTKEILEQIAKNLTGNPVTVTVELKS